MGWNHQLENLLAISHHFQVVFRAIPKPSTDGIHPKKPAAVKKGPLVGWVI